MAKYIRKIGLKVADSQTVQLPASADHLRVERVGDMICLWADAEATEASVDRTIIMIEPDGLLPAGSVDYLGSVHMAGSNVEWHVYEEL